MLILYVINYKLNDKKIKNVEKENNWIKRLGFL